MIDHLGKNILLGCIVILCGVRCSDRSSTTEEDLFRQKADSVLQLMTLREKVGQMNQYVAGTEMTGPTASSGDTKEKYNQFVTGEVGSVISLLGAEETYQLQKIVVENTRLKIPLLFAYDVIHGYKTIFPIPLGEASSWDLEMIERSAQIAAIETASSGVHWTFSPMIDITRDARWGRVMEGSGEDPYLTSEIAKAKVRGYQGQDLSDEWTIAACAKHFAGYGFAESGKDYNTVEIGKNTLLNVVFPPFKAVADIGISSFMNSFNDLDGIPSTANQTLVNETLHGRWGYNGIVISDWNSVGELINHGVAANKKEAAKLAALAGCDIDMEGHAYVENLVDLVTSGQVSEQIIDEAVIRVLTLKFKLGLFEDPYKYSNVEREKFQVLNKEHLTASRKAGVSSIVLLKNEGKILPLKNQKRIAVIGPLAKDKDAPLGNWRAQGETNSAVSFYEGLEAAIGNGVSLTYAEGCKLSIGRNDFGSNLTIEENDRTGFNEAKKIAKNSEIVFMVLGEPAHMTGEARARSKIGLPGLQLELLKEVYKANKNIVLILMNGRPLTIPWEAENIPSILETWYLGSEAGNAIAEIVTGKSNPSGKLPMSFPRSVGQLPIYYNHLSTGRPQPGSIFYPHHMDIEESALYPFGYGLSYSEFTYENFEVQTQGDSIVHIKVDIKNIGEVKGEEIMQLYIRDLVATVARPVLELKAFQKLGVDSKSRETVHFTLTQDDLSFYNSIGDFVFESGDFEIFVGPNSRDLLSHKVNL
ncbi:MAG: beta-glucosidase BglX [Reichenbachiella sp.]